MKHITTTFLKLTLFTIGLTILTLSIFWLPWLSENTVNMFPEYSHLQYPVLMGIYVTALPFFFALYQAFKILKYIEEGRAFLELSVQALNYIIVSAIAISILYVFGAIILISQSALHPGIAIMGILIVLTSFVIAAFTAILQKLLKSALDIKLENELTV
ncbi:DUF2975 domain-containing protein [Bacillus kexueae]|uniref:DUF2975 domain-containing protein n=1 Tax=Aeribacillus kexueae TaxID=2078952 RepID=UPI001FAF7345|nr:DUF2975 domain-containing protein [Bacillus kexueae]